VDVENFSDDMAEVQKEVIAPVADVAADEVADPRHSVSQDQASPEFTKELEMTVHQGGGILLVMFLWWRLVKIFLRVKTLLFR
jgi:hypothetical protein